MATGDSIFTVIRNVMRIQEFQEVSTNAGRQPFNAFRLKLNKLLTNSYEFFDWRGTSHWQPVFENTYFMFFFFRFQKT